LDQLCTHFEIDEDAGEARYERLAREVTRQGVVDEADLGSPGGCMEGCAVLPIGARSSGPGDATGAPESRRDELRSENVVGKLFASGAEAPRKHPKVFARESMTGLDRLLIGGGADSVAVLNELVGALREPMFVLVVLAEPRCSSEGRYESEPMTRGEVAAFLAEFRDFFVSDARSSVWVGSIGGDGLVVLDEHDLLYAYGPLDEFGLVLRDAGYVDGIPAAPVPHVHRFNPELDALEVLLVNATTWRRVLPLEEEDER
jgi:hypothetical protein